jgi:hypothetical protein
LNSDESSREQDQCLRHPRQSTLCGLDPHSQGPVLGRATVSQRRQGDGAVGVGTLRRRWGAARRAPGDSERLPRDQPQGGSRPWAPAGGAGASRSRLPAHGCTLPLLVKRGVAEGIAMRVTGAPDAERVRREPRQPPGGGTKGGRRAPGRQIRRNWSRSPRPTIPPAAKPALPFRCPVHRSEARRPPGGISREPARDDTLTASSAPTAAPTHFRSV